MPIKPSYPVGTNQEVQKGEYDIEKLFVELKKLCDPERDKQIMADIITEEMENELPDEWKTPEKKTQLKNYVMKELEKERQDYKKKRGS